MSVESVLQMQQIFSTSRQQSCNLWALLFRLYKLQMHATERVCSISNIMSQQKVMDLLQEVLNDLEDACMPSSSGSATRPTSSRAEEAAQSVVHGELL